MPATYQFSEFQRRYGRACGRAIIAIGENAAVDAKEYADVITGTMKRSIHCAPYNYNGAADEDAARGADMLIPLPTQAEVEHGADFGLEMGSWVPYACVEECGRNHRFVTPAVQGMMGVRSDRIIEQAFAEEGL